MHSEIVETSGYHAFHDDRVAALAASNRKPDLAIDHRSPGP
jgi:hypothetical protein